MESISRSWLLVKESFAVLKQEKELILFPIIGGFLQLLILISYWVPLGLFYFRPAFAEDRPLHSGDIYGFLFLYYLISYFIFTFFTAALVSCAHIRLTGGDPSFKDGIKSAFAHIWKIFLWSLISSTVGFFLRLISEKSGIIGKIVASLLGVVWNLVTYLIVPILIYENKSVKDSIIESETLFKTTWGEQISGNFTLDAFFSVLMAVSLIPIGILFFVIPNSAKNGAFPFIPILISVGFIGLYFIILLTFKTTLESIFSTALFIYATTKKVPHQFSKNVIEKAFKNKKDEGIIHVEYNKTT